MKGNENHSNLTKWMSGKGFYLALALCIVGTGTAAWVAVDRTIDSIDQSNANHISAQEEKDRRDFSSLEEAGKGQSGVGITPSAPSQPPAKSPSASARPTKPKDTSGSSDSADKPQTLAFVLPVNGELITPYSNGKLVKDKTLNEWRTHNGIDLKAPKGSPVTCAAAGTVTNVYDDAMWGTTVEMSHANGLVTVYCGLEKKPPVKKGDKLEAGRQIGFVGQVPCELTMGEHLHFAVKKDGKWVDPIASTGMQTPAPKQ